MDTNHIENLVSDLNSVIVQHGKMQELQNEVIAALSRDYYAIYYIDLDGDRFVILRSKDMPNKSAFILDQNAKSCSSALEKFCKKCVCAEDQKHFAEMTNLAYIKKRLQEEDTFMFRYRVHPQGKNEYVEARIAQGENKEKGNYVIMGVRGVDSEMRKELEHQEQIENDFKKVRHSLSQEEQYRRGIVSGAILVYNVNISKNLLEDNIYVMLEGENISAVSLVGLEPPCKADEFYTRFANQKVTEEYREGFLQGTDIKRLREAFLRGENEQVLEFEAYFQEHKPIIVRQTMLLFKDLTTGDIIGLCNCKDITEARRKEIETQKALVNAFETATMANQAKTDFLSRMSHDIRTPMNGIIGMTAIASAHLDDPERVKDSLEKISASSRHLLGIINDILDMSKIESGKMNLNEEDFNLSDLLANLFVMVRPQVKERGHDLKVHIHDISHEDVIGDSLRIQQVFVNIMSNAIKYTPEGGEITVSVTEKPTSKMKSSCYEFIFEDNGIGMTQEFIDKMFDPFERAEDLRTSKVQGTGLGMAITRNLVSMMGGQIEVESTVGKGSKFTVTIFLKLQDTVSIDTDVLAGLPVLLAEDDEISCENTAVMLQEIGMASEWVLSGREAVEKVEKRHKAKEDYFAVLLDWKMPGMSGIEATRIIRKMVGDEMPIVVISAYDWSDIELEARAAGVTAFISKPAFKSNLAKLFLGLVKNTEYQEEKVELTEISNYTFTDKRILVVEDNDLNREIAREILSETGLLIEEAENGKRAVDLFDASPEKYYDLILMDVQMPVMNGYDATVAIRALNRRDAKSIPIIAMTANAFAEDVHAAMSAGMNEHIAKPLDLEKVLGCIERWTR